MNEELLKSVYYAPDTGLINARALYAKLKADNKKITLKEVDEFVKRQDVAQRFKPSAKVMFYPVYSTSLNHYQCDLMFFDKYKTQNDGISSFLTLININTRKGYIVGVKNKTAAVVYDALKNLIADHKIVIDSIEVDKGGEFALFDKLVKKVERTDRANHRGLMIERFNKTMRDKINKYVRVYGTRFIDSLDKLVLNYNNTKHSGTGKTPNSMTTEDEKQYILDKLVQTADTLKHYQTIFTVGRIVRKVKKNVLFVKDNTHNTKKTYKVVGWDNLRVELDDGSRELPQNLAAFDSVEVVHKTPEKVVKPKAARKEHKKDLLVKQAIAPIKNSDGFVETPISDKRGRHAMKIKKVVDM